MNTIKSILLSTTLVSAAMGLSAMPSGDIADYVYPANAVKSPTGMTYMADGKSYVALNDDNTRIIRYDIKTGKELGTVLDVTKSRDYQLDKIGGFQFSPDESHILVYPEAEYIYRRSFKAEYYVYEVRHNVLKPLSFEFKKQQSPIWSPDGRMVAFVADNNIHIRKLDYNTEVAVTTDGEFNKVINGVPDWAYEEEFTTSCSMSWAPDNQTLCYLKYNESDVPLYSFSLYEGSCDPKKEYALYPGSYTYKYPVSGEANSIVTLHSYNVDNRSTKEISFKDHNIEYIPRIQYSSVPERLMVTTLNREQNRIEIYAVNPKSTVSKSVYVDESADGWIDPSAWEMLKLYPDFFVVTSERSGYNHLYQYSYSGAMLKQLTSGDFDVTDYYGYDKTAGAHYYQSTSGALNRIIGKIDAKGRTVVLGENEGTSSASFSGDMAYYTLNYSNVATPNVYTLCTSAGKSVRVLEDNAAYASRFSGLPEKEFFTMQSDGYTLNGSMLKPADFNPSRKYPVIMSQYSGPGSQEVLNRWKMDWDYYYVQKGYIVICVDGRGTGGRGSAFKHAVYRRLGHFETIDQVAAARHAGELPYVDAGRIGIYGWSYGGYETLMAASAPSSPYKAAVAVAPVTSWRYYDSIYTERFMLTPRENEDGYEEGSPINFVDRMNTNLLIMHGTADDNVHLSNTMEYVSALQMSGRLCDMLLFPNMNHSIYGCNARALVYTKMLDFFDRNLK